MTQRTTRIILPCHFEAGASLQWQIVVLLMVVLLIVVLLIVVLLIFVLLIRIPTPMTGGAPMTTAGGVPMGAGTMRPYLEPGGGGTKTPSGPMGAGPAMTPGRTAAKAKPTLGSQLRDASVLCASTLSRPGVSTNFNPGNRARLGNSIWMLATRLRFSLWLRLAPTRSRRTRRHIGRTRGSSPRWPR